MAQITKLYDFEAAHFLPYHVGKCRNLHGHSYRVEVSISGSIKKLAEMSDDGMVRDFGDVSAALKPIIAKLDHTLLNDILETPTAERLAVCLYGALVETLHMSRNPDRVAVWETATSAASVNYMDWIEMDALRFAINEEGKLHTTSVRSDEKGTISRRNRTKNDALR